MAPRPHRAAAVGAALAACPALAASAVPMRGWMSWERYTCETDCTRFPETCISERLILTMADAMAAEGFVAAGYEYIQIDDCYLASRDGNGDLRPDPSRFPRGIKYIADYVHAKGMKLGLYGDIGTATCAGGPGFSVSATTDSKADAQLQRDAELLMSWGMDSLKVDGCNADVAAMNVTYPKLGAALAAAAAKQGRPAPWYSCSWPDYVGDTLCNHERKEPCVPLHQIAEHCNSARIYKDIADRWTDMVDIIQFWGKNTQLADLRNGLRKGTVYYNDPDQLMVGNNGLSKTEAEAQMGMWVMFAAPLIMSTELRNGTMSKEMKDILLNEEVLAVADDALGLQATQCVSGCSQNGVLYGGATSVWSKKLADGSVAVALLNTGNFGNQGAAFGDFNITFAAAAVGLPCGAPPPPPCGAYSHTTDAYQEPVPTDNIRCDPSMSVDQLKAACCADDSCASFSAGRGGQGGCLKGCSAKTEWVNGTGNDGYTKTGGCGAAPSGGGAFEVRDLFKRKDLGTWHGSFWAEVDESSLMMLRLSCK